MTMKTEDGKQYPAEAYAYVPDPKEPSTWKLRLWEDPEKKVTASQVGAAIAALGKGYRGNKVDIPDADLSKVKAKVRAAWKEANPDKSDSDMPDVIKKQLGPVAKAFAVVQKLWGAGEIYDPYPNGQKPSHDFATALQTDEYSDQLLGGLMAALADTVDSILDDPDATDKQTMVNQALQDFEDKLQAVGIMKVGRKMSGNRLANLKDIHQKLGAMIDDLDSQDNTGQGDDDVSIDKSKLSEDVRKYLEEIEKRAQDAETKVQELTKGATGSQTEEEIMKAALPEPLRKRFEEMEKQAKQAEEIAKRERDERMTREYIAKAREFEALAVNPEEFGPVLKKLAESAPDEYAKVADVLKAADEAIKKGGLFAEVGKSGSSAAGSALDQLNAIAKEKVEKSAGKLTQAQAFAEATRENPSLYLKYREEM